MSLQAKLDDALRIFMTAYMAHSPIATFAGFSGGNDSTVVAHWARRYIKDDGLFHIDTGTGVPGVRSHVESAAAKMGVNLVVYEAGDSFKRMVLGTDEFWGELKVARREKNELTIKRFIADQRLLPDKGVAPGQPYGFPGPGGHGMAYNRLKERQFEALRRDVKAERGESRLDRVMMLTGIRQSESQRRKNRPEITRSGCLVFVNPLSNWTSSDMQEYRTLHRLERSDVSAALEMSGECTCGAFADVGEREMLMSLWPDWWESLHGELERECVRRKIPQCVWGRRPPGIAINTEAQIGPFCNGCEIRQSVASTP